MDGKATPCCNIAGHSVVMAGFSVQDNVGNLQTVQEIFKKNAPILSVAGVGNEGIAVFPKKLVTVIETNPPCFVTTLTKAAAELVKKRPMRPLQKQKAPDLDLPVTSHK